MSRRVVSCRVVSCRIVSSRVVSCRVVSCRVVSCCVASRRVASRHVTSRHVTSRQATSPRVTPSHVLSHRVTCLLRRPTPECYLQCHSWTASICAPSAAPPTRNGPGAAATKRALPPALLATSTTGATTSATSRQPLCKPRETTSVTTKSVRYERNREAQAIFEILVRGLTRTTSLTRSTTGKLRFLRRLAFAIWLFLNISSSKKCVLA